VLDPLLEGPDPGAIEEEAGVLGQSSLERKA
jgi:hypothetical protein